MGEPDYTCGICQAAVEMHWNHSGAGGRLPPLCFYCESVYSEGIGKPSGGSMRDRRTAMQIAALAEALRCEAARQSWPASWRTPHVEP